MFIEALATKARTELVYSYDSPEVVRCRSEEILARSGLLLAEIEQVRGAWKEKLAGEWGEDKERLVADEVVKLRVSKEDLRSRRIKAVGLAAAVFETAVDDKGKLVILRPDQILAAFYLLNGISLEIREEDENFCLEKPSGEGKTFVIGVAAGADAVLGNKVHVLCPSYFLALRDSAWLGEYYYRLLGPEEGVVSAVINKSNNNQRRVLIPHASPQFFDEREQFIYQPNYVNDRLQEEDKRLTCLKPLDSRRNAYSRMIVYVDCDSIAFDWLRQRRWKREKNDIVFGEMEESGFKEGDLSKITAYPDEADTILDKAKCPYVLAEILRGPSLWEYAAEYLGLDRIVTEVEEYLQELEQTETETETETETGKCLSLDEPKTTMSRAEQIEFAQRIALAVWRALELDLRDTRLIEMVGSKFKIKIPKEIDKKQVYKKIKEEIYKIAYSDQPPLEISPEKMRGLDVLVFDDGALVSERFYSKLECILTLCLDDVFSDMFPSYKTDLSKMYLIINFWIEHFGWPFIQQAAEIYFNQREGLEFISREQEAVLVDKVTGLPMEKRQLQQWGSLFLAIKNNWLRWLGEFKPEGIVMGFEDCYKKVESFYGAQVRISREVGRLAPLVLCSLYGRVRFVSATLVPEAREMRHLFGADTLAMGRYQSIDREKQWKPEQKKSLISIEVEESDGGPLIVEFCKDAKAVDESMMATIKKRGQRPVLCVVETVKEAEELYNQLRENGISEDDLQIATARTEMPPQSAGFLIVQGRTVSLYRKKGTQISEAVDNAGTPAKVTVATLLASRGIHIYLTDESIKAGGLIELIKGIFSNERAFLQVIGRALRGGDPGYRKVYLYPQEPNALWMRFWPQMKSVRCIFPPTAEKLKEQAFSKTESLWRAALNGNQKAMRKLWQAIKGAQKNRYGQEAAARRTGYLRDVPLEDCLQRARERLKKEFPILDSATAESAEGRELRELLDLWWSNFLIRYDHRFFNFLNSYRREPRFRNQFWKAEAANLLDSQLNSLIAQLKEMGFKREES